ncbi:class I SAM-dependent methyltransferase [Mesorhizobium captivum]|uniref:class I SAM-dependent methyltransferase n=1 Tax=Mesorhizobium captivum TaxID=3072319 RepID=UPI002A241814|nr:methyltransferase domain-containing protein [Mesorhizobium sp. VK3C]MDX8450234.1 methyltransferase domain-containing protein [Mesorhizobium sp. VK3C]
MVKTIDVEQAAWAPYNEIARHYDDQRPGYPTGAIQELVNRLIGLQPAGSIVADIGCGTGIFTRLLAARLNGCYDVVGVEPSEQMRQRAVETTPSHARIRYFRAPAERLPFGPLKVAAITAAGAAQLFDRGKFYAEAAKALTDRGLVALIQNKRRHAESRLFQCYEVFLSQYVPGYATGAYADAWGTHSPAYFPRELRDSEWFEEVDVHQCFWARTFSIDEFEVFAKSTLQLKTAIAAHDERVVIDALREILAEVSEDGQVELSYRTEITFAVRRKRI